VACRRSGDHFENQASIVRQDGFEEGHRLVLSDRPNNCRVIILTSKPERHDLIEEGLSIA
jgi:hypothetical protein